MSGLEIPADFTPAARALDAAGTPLQKLLKDVADDKDLREAVKDFEAVLIYRLLGEMKRTVPESGLLGTAASEQYQDLFWLYLAQDLAEKGGLGLCSDLYKQLSCLEGPSAAGATLELSR